MFTLQRRGELTTRLTINVITADGPAADYVPANENILITPATAGQDYTAINSETPLSNRQLVFAANQTAVTFTITVTNDELNEPDEMLSLTFTPAVDTPSAPAPASATGIITNDDEPMISIRPRASLNGNSGVTRKLPKVTT